jgi:2-polyprenyl-3-methyl-5-hydroxy-6-metoxy-1,4-benzoquinol methylase
MNWPELVDKTREIWEQNATWWDNQKIDESPFTRRLIKPAVLRLLAVKEGETILDLACGNGWLARDLATLGAHIVACDFSSALLSCARARTPSTTVISYMQLDLTDESDLARLGCSRFDCAVCNMALMDIANIEPLLRTVQLALKPGGRFVFSIPHPCFHTPSTILVAERQDLVSHREISHSISIKSYFGAGPEACSVLKNQPRSHYLFHRPLSVILRECFAAGLVLDGLEEPIFPASVSNEQALGWANLTSIPPILVARLRRPLSS